MAKADLDDDGAVENAGGGKKKTIIIVAALLVSLACIAAGVAFYLTSSGEEAANKPETEKGAKRHGPPAIFALEPFVVNIRDNADIRYLKLKVEFEVGAAGKEIKEEFDPYLPQVRDSILMLLTSKTLDEVKDVPGKNRLRQEIMTSACRIFPRGKIKQVFFTDFVVQ